MFTMTKLEDDYVDCPFSLIRDKGSTYCRKEHCGFWNPERSQCAVVTLAQGLTQQKEKGDPR